MALSYHRPADELRPAISAYHVFGRTAPSHGEQVDWFLPGTANVRIVDDAEPVGVRMRRGSYVLPPVSMFGPATRALRATTGTGWMLGFGVSAIGWARLRLPRADVFTDRVVPLSDLIGGGLDLRLSEAARDSRDGDRGYRAGDGSAMKAALDAILGEAMGAPHPDEPLIHRLNEFMLDHGHAGVAAAAEALGVGESVVRRIALHYFGLPAKMLFNRARFLQSFLDYIANGRDLSRIDPSYFDASHFLRDARMFLDMTPRRFHLLDTPFLTASLAERRAVMGSPDQVLDRI